MNRERFAHPEWGRAWRVFAYMMTVGVLVVGVLGFKQAHDVNDRVLDNQRIMCGLITIIGEEHEMFASASPGAGAVVAEIERLNAKMAATCPILGRPASER